MTQVKLGRWRTRDGREAVVEERQRYAGYVWRGTVRGEFRTWKDDGKYFGDVPHPLDLVEYLDDPTPPFDPRSLKPGDYYVDQDGRKRGPVIGTHPTTGDVVVADGLFSASFAPSSGGFPAGPWVEPPKQRKATLVACDGVIDAFHEYYVPYAADEFAQRVTFTEGKGFELGEVVKQ